MKILITSSLKRKTDKDITASRSRVIYQLTRGLVEKGHDVSILGTGDTAVEGAKTIAIDPIGWVDAPPVENPFFRDVASLVRLGRTVVDIQGKFDMIHNHTYPDFFVPQFENELTTPLLTTIHIQATDYVDKTFSLFKKSHFASISYAHRSRFSKTDIKHIVHNGVNTDLFSYHEQKDDYMLWLGRLSKARNSDGSFMDPKGVKWAIKLAQKTGRRLVMSGDVEDIEFFNTEVKPHLTDKIEWKGKVGASHPFSKQEVVRLYQSASVFLMTINWFEPFGLVMAESMSCGTPVIGFDKGAVSEVIADGKTGFVVNPEKGVDGLARALSKIDTIKPKDCRDHVVNNFSIDTMVSNYEKLYKEILNNK